MFKRTVASLLTAVFLLLQIAQASTLTQLHPWTSGNLVRSAWFNNEFVNLYSGHNDQETRITTLESYMPSTLLSVTHGGTGAATAGAARLNLGAAASGANSDITSLSGLTTALSVAQGGTGLNSIIANRILYSSGVNTFAPLDLNSTLGISSGTLGVQNNTSTQKINVLNNGSSVGTRSSLNLIPGTNTSLTVTDNSGSDRVDVTVNSANHAIDDLTDVTITSPANTQVLTYNGSAWVNSTPTTGALVKLATATASSSASLNFQGFFSSTYDEYEVHYVNIVPATDDTEMYIRVSTDGSTFISSGTPYSSAIRYNHTNNADTVDGSAAANQIQVHSTVANRGVSNTASHGGAIGKFTIINPLSATSHKSLYGIGMSPSGAAGGGDPVNYMHSGKYESNTAITGFQILMSSGNIASGYAILYGVAK